jgi:Collagen triple helix repeat (20 copies)
MPLNIDDDVNPADNDNSLNLIQTVNVLAYQVKKLTGKSSWKTPPDKSLVIIQEDIANGLRGEQGIQGLKGDTGETGAQGIQGLKGDTGETGAQGIQGLKGDTGETGAQGIQGLKGNSALWTYTTAAAFQGSTYRDYVSKPFAANTFTVDDYLMLEIAYRNLSGNGADISVTFGGNNVLILASITANTNAISQTRFLIKGSSLLNPLTATTTSINVSNSNTLIIQARHRTNNSTITLYMAALHLFRP